MASDLSQFTYQLLDNIRGKHELDLIVNKTEKDETFESLARLNLAIKMEEKQVNNLLINFNKNLIKEILLKVCKSSMLSTKIKYVN
jgi:hypothetical protein